MKYFGHLFIASAAFLVLTGVAQAASDCDRLIPASGAYALTTQSGQHTVFDSAKSMFCSNDFTASSQSSGWQFSLDVPGYGSGGAGANNNNSSTTRSAFCSDSSKDFASSDKIALYRLQGDAVLAAAFVQCITAINPSGSQVYAVNAKAIGDDITVTITPNLSQNAFERITDVAIVSGAQAKPGVAIAPGRPLIGKSPVVGGYSFTGPQATFIVRTSTGDTSFFVYRCRKGSTAGSFSVKATTYVTVPQSAGVQRWDQGLPQAGCHPHCQLVSEPDPKGGDPVTMYFRSPPDITLANPRTTCDGNGCQFEDNWSATLLDPHQVAVHVRSRSIGVTIHVFADGTTMQKVGSETQLAQGTVVYGDPFSFRVPNSAVGAYINYGAAIYPIDTLADGAPFKLLATKQPVGNDYAYTLRYDDSSCPAT